MPIREYRCPKCGHKFERLENSSSPAPTCPSCGEKEVKRLFSPFGFRLTSGGTIGSAAAATEAASAGGGGCSSCSSGNCQSCHH